ncbi:nuclear pore complex protein Nup205-like [Pollicipes pollicipes]|uniref:nuclear pore complex protein Nup205-like n=1 Tax=Pollicipes pollicipes TaxID=41117 RepID=UPI001885335E|nr:nuclear pore complex protein Nup205-like [Pollicipes pollicipes]
MALLYNISVSRVLKRQGAETLLRQLPLLADAELAPQLHARLAEGEARLEPERPAHEEPWQTPGLRTVLQFAWAMTLSSLRPLDYACRGSGNGELARIIEKDEILADMAIKDGAFLHMREKMLANEMFHTEEFFVRHLHDLMSELMDAMPLKLKDLRNRADEAAHTIQMHQQEGLEPPENLPRHFEQLLRLLTALYERDPLGLGLSRGYWVTEAANHRQPSLHKFVRLAGDLLPPPLFVPYVELLAALASSPATAPHCFSLLTAAGTPPPLNLAHFFSSLHQYYNSLMREAPSMSRVETYASATPASKGLTARQLKDMVAMLRLVAVIAGRICKLCGVMQQSGVAHSGHFTAH